MSLRRFSAPRHTGTVGLCLTYRIGITAHPDNGKGKSDDWRVGGLSAGQGTSAHCHIVLRATLASFSRLNARKTGYLRY